MRFFPWDPPESEFPGIVPIDALPFAPSEQAAVAITGISAYTTGFEISVTRLLRPRGPGMDADPVPGASKVMYADRQSCQISLLFADGRRVISERSHGDSEPTGPILRSLGGGGTSHYSVTRLWVLPLPPKWLLEFVCQWPMYGITETQVSIDAQLILDAALRSVRPWPQDTG